MHTVTMDDVRAALLPRPRAAHKNDFGHLLIIAGSRGMAGAALIAYFLSKKPRPEDLWVNRLAARKAAAAEAAEPMDEIAAVNGEEQKSPNDEKEENSDAGDHH